MVAHPSPKLLPVTSDFRRNGGRWAVHWAPVALLLRVVPAVCAVAVLHFWIAYHSRRYGQELQHNLLAEQQHILNNALHGIQATVVEKAHSAAVKPILDAKAEELTHEIVKRDKHIEARDQRIAVQDGELKVLGERLSNITKDLEQERANLQRVQQAADELAQQVDDDVLGDKVVFQRALTPELLQQAASRLSEPRGIVMCSGGTTYTINSYAVAYTIRHHHKSALPITLMYFKNEDSSGPNTVHINDATIRFMQERIPNLSVMDLSAFPVPPHHRWLWHPERKLSKVTAGFKLKVLALYAAPYKEVLLLDAETLPVINPDTLFDSAEFQQHGNMFWPDAWCHEWLLFHKFGIRSRWWGLKPEDRRPQQAETGQLLINKARHADVMEWVLWLNTHDSFTYRYTHGDKDTFGAAFYVTDKPEQYYQVSQQVSFLMHDSHPEPHKFWNVGRAQHHPNGSIAFLHRLGEHRFQRERDDLMPFNHLLYQPSCDWCQKYKDNHTETNWPFPNEAAKVITAEQCQYNFVDFRADMQRCGIAYDFASSGEKDTPPVWKVPEQSTIQAVQRYALDAFRQARASIKQSSELFAKR